MWSTVEQISHGDSEISIGRPIGNTQVHIVDAAGELAPVGIAGEICTGGAGRIAHAHDGPELTAERFIPDRFGEKWKRAGACTGPAISGAGARMASFIILAGMDDQLKMRGFRIEPWGEIEALSSGIRCACGRQLWSPRKYKPTTSG